MPLAIPLPFRYWADYTSLDFSRLDRDQLIAVLPVGAVEQHGPHLPMAVDSAIIDALVTETCQRLPSASPVLFLPTCRIGKSNEHGDFPGTLSLSAQTVLSLWTDIGESVARAGVRKLVLFNSHGGQISIMDIVGHDLRARLGMFVVSVNWFSLGLPEGLFSTRDQRFGIHGGDLETSMMLSISPDTVVRTEARNFASRNENFLGVHRHLGLGAGGRIGWQTQDLNAEGAVGEAHLATPEKGATTIEHVVGRFVELLEEIDNVDVDSMHGTAAWK